MHDLHPATASPAASEETPTFLVGGGEMGALLRSHDWSSSPLGKPNDWPRSLSIAFRIMLTSRQPIWIGWGKDLIFFYNDAYKSIIGGKHPWALGRPTREVWREIWNDIGPMLATAMGGDRRHLRRRAAPDHGAQRLSRGDLLHLLLQPDPDDDGSAGGIICANSDDTQRVIGERQLALLRELAASTGQRAQRGARSASRRQGAGIRSSRSPVRPDLHGRARGNALTLAARRESSLVIPQHLRDAGRNRTLAAR